jgi:hypothetical protein
MNSINPHSREREAIAHAQALPLSVPTLPQTEIGPVSPPPVPRTERVRRSWPRGSGIIALLLCVGVAEQTFSHDWKPSTVAGKMSANFAGQTMEAINNKEIELAKDKAIAEQQAIIEAQRANVQGLCALGGLLGPEVAQVCTEGSNVYFDTARQSTDRSLSQ